jgi:Phycobilisome degradation protein nblA
MNQKIELTMEQEFRLQLFASQVQQISLAQAQALLIEQQQLMMHQDMMYQKLLKHEWKLDVNDISPLN